MLLVAVPGSDDARVNPSAAEGIPLGNRPSFSEAVDKPLITAGRDDEYRM